MTTTTPIPTAHDHPTGRQTNTMPHDTLSAVEQMLRGAVPELTTERRVTNAVLKPTLEGLTVDAREALRKYLPALEFLSNRPTASDEDRALVRLVKVAV